MKQSKKQKPLATIRKPVKAEVYRAKFRPFESAKYLDVRALKRAKKAVIEIGSLEAPGVKATVAAEVRKGSITKIRPLGCETCGKPGTRTKPGRAVIKEVALEVSKRVRALGQPTIKLPVPITSARIIEIPIWIIVIIIYTDPIDFCVLVDETGGGWCLYCLFGGSVCGGPPT